MKSHSSLIFAFLAISLIMMVSLSQLSRAENKSKASFRRVSPQWIAALGDPSATSGNNAQTWGLWRIDPGPRGVKLKNYDKLKSTNGVTPARWKMDETDWWLEEHGLIMEKPNFPLPPGKYVVTGGRGVKAVLTVYQRDKEGAQRWELDKGVKLYDVTHMPCRSARYRPATSENSCSPDNVQEEEFPVAPGATMPEVEGCKKQDYEVLIVIGVAVENR